MEIRQLKRTIQISVAFYFAKVISVVYFQHLFGRSPGEAQAVANGADSPRQEPSQRDHVVHLERASVQQLQSRRLL